MRRTAFASASLGVALLASSFGLPVVEAGTLRPGSVTIMPGREFSADSYVYRVLPDDAPLDPHSARYVSEILRLIKENYGHADINIDRNTPAIYLVPADQPTVAVRHLPWEGPASRLAALEAQWTAVPLPDGFEPAPGDDNEAVVYQPSTGRVWEFWAMRQTGARSVDSAGRSKQEWGAAWGGRLDSIATNPGYWQTVTPPGYKFGTTASGIPFLAGLLTIDELRRGEINHIVGFALPENAADRWVFPAQRTDGRSASADAVPQGAILRLPADLDLAALDMSPLALAIARAVQRHGMILWDTSAVVGFRAENPGRQFPEGHPFWKEKGVLGCRRGASRPGSQLIYQCWPPALLANFPWDKLQVLATAGTGR